jgi:Zn-dependent protease with chaperone function
MPHALPRRLDTRLSLTSAVSALLPSRPSRLFWRVWFGALCVALIAGTARRAAAEEAASVAAAEARRVQDLVDAMRLELAVSHEVSVELVASNPLRASVEPVKGAAGTFRLSIEQAFLEQLTQVELRAVIAHELGHVWIYTHHPYLQTEQLANQIALRVVTRESLDSVYGKVWPDGAGQGPLPRYSEARAEPAPGPQN